MLEFHDTHGDQRFWCPCNSMARAEMYRVAFFKRLAVARSSNPDAIALDSQQQTRLESQQLQPQSGPQRAQQPEVKRRRKANAQQVPVNLEAATTSSSAGGTGIVGRNFSFVRVLRSSCDEGMEFEVKCIGLGHPDLFRNQSYILKALFNFGPVDFPFEIEPHPNISQHFCQFQDSIPHEFYDKISSSVATSHLFTWIVLEHHPDSL
ncbi:hypothetical protein Pelo_376 [Pelomyxa schiedti]|nr:hypothetical protein Pelo_376 [Pelomyxa schiedti]